MDQMNGLPAYANKEAWLKLANSGLKDKEIAAKYNRSRQAVSQGMVKSGVRVVGTDNRSKYVPWSPVPVHLLQRPLLVMLREIGRYLEGFDVENALKVREALEFWDDATFKDGTWVGPVVVVFDRGAMEFYLEPARPEELSPRVYARARAYV